MAEFSKSEFAELCGMKPSAFSNAIARGKVKVNAAGKIDDKEEINSSFFKTKLLEKRNRLEAEQGSETEEETTNSADDRAQALAPPETAGDAYALSKQQQQMQIKKLTEEVDILKIKKEKMQGEVIPTDLVKTVIVQHSKSIVSEFYNAADSLLMKISKLKGLDRNEMAELRGELVGVINQAVNDSVVSSKKMIKNIVNEYATKRGRGERI